MGELRGVLDTPREVIGGIAVLAVDAEDLVVVKDVSDTVLDNSGGFRTSALGVGVVTWLAPGAPDLVAFGSLVVEAGVCGGESRGASEWGLNQRF